MENRILFGLLMLGEGDLARNYILFCFAASFGVLQFVAGRYEWRGLRLLPARPSRWLGVTLVGLAYLWFFTVQPDLFIPGLAGGELLTFSLLGFVLALGCALLAGFVSMRVLNRLRVRQPAKRAVVRIGHGRAEWWLPDGTPSACVLALREMPGDGMDVLAGALVARGAAVLLCDTRWKDAARIECERYAAQFPQAVCVLVGLGPGADCVLHKFADDDFFAARVALAPYGEAAPRRAGLHWLRETDYVCALGQTLTYRVQGDDDRPTHPASIGPQHGSTADLRPNTLVVYGAEDDLIGEQARAYRSHAVYIAEARHFDLAAQSETQRLVGELCRVPAARGSHIERLGRSQTE